MMHSCIFAIKKVSIKVYFTAFLYLFYLNPRPTPLSIRYQISSRNILIQILKVSNRRKIQPRQQGTYQNNL